MSDNKFSENMVVCAVGILSPGNISDSCEICPHNKSSFPGVLIAGVTKEAVMLLSEKVEIVPEGTKAKVAELEASNAELLEALKDCCVIARPKNPSSCCPAYRPGEHGGCAENEDCECNIWKAIQKASGQI